MSNDDAGLQDTQYAYQYSFTGQDSPAQCIARSDADEVGGSGSGGSNSDSIRYGNFFKGIKWSPDGIVIAAHLEDNTLRLYDVGDVLVDLSSTDYQTSCKALRSSLSIRHGETLIDYAWYPYMSRHEPSVCCLVESMRDHPIHLRDTNSGKVRASYTAFDDKDVLMAASSVLFTPDAAGILAGFNGRIAQFDTQRPGLPIELVSTSPSRRSKDGMKGIVSCMAISPSAAPSRMVACGSFSGQMSLRSLNQLDADCIGVWPAPEEYGGRGVTEIKWSPDGTRLWAASRQSMHIVGWDIRDMRGPWAVIPRNGSTQQRMGFDLDTAGRHVVAGEMDGSVSFHDVYSSESEQVDKGPVRLDAHDDLVGGVASHPFYAVLATASGQRHFGEDGSTTDTGLQQGTSGCVRSHDSCIRLWSDKEPKELTRVGQFMSDCMGVGGLRGFSYFSVYIRSSEEIIVRVYRGGQKPKATGKMPLSSATICDDIENMDKLQATEESKQTILLSKGGNIDLPFDLSDKAMEDDKGGINFLIAGYPRYRCPYVWLRTDQASLIVAGESQKDAQKDIPLYLEAVRCWQQYDIRPWDVLVEVICTAINPPPDNPFAIDYEYFDKITVEERVVLTGAMLEFLRRVFLRHYFFSDIVLADIQKLQKMHFSDINVLRELQLRAGFRDPSAK
ncbi:hypothetical protein GGI12_000418 [Dipsacomyces acuminosporus]|nr:hypothetical protein GGI12_000418 [Dipsacomyces acuminosporus]